MSEEPKSGVDSAVSAPEPVSEQPSISAVTKPSVTELVSDANKDGGTTEGDSKEGVDTVEQETKVATGIKLIIFINIITRLLPIVFFVFLNLISI